MGSGQRERVRETNITVEVFVHMAYGYPLNVRIFIQRGMKIRGESGFRVRLILETWI